jgi:hypothetical protein
MKDKEVIKNKYFDLINSKCNGAIPLFIVVGSQAYGTNLPTSDLDIAGVFLQSKEDIFGFNYIEQIDEKKGKSDFGDKEKDDAVFYEVKRFLQLLQKANPTTLSILFSPEDCVIYKHPIFDVILNKKEDFVTKMCKNSFAGYAVAQCKKAKGLDKKQNWEKDKVTRKDIFDFCYVINGQKTIPLNTWFVNNGYNSDVQKFCGVVNVPNARDVYALFFDSIASNCFSIDESESNKEHNKLIYKQKGNAVGLGYKGIQKVGESDNAGVSNQLRLSSIPKGEEAICNIIFNKDGYSQHCKDYKSYIDWINNRNEQRYVDNKGHNQKIDSKNIMHLVRLIRMSREIAERKEFVIRRPDAEYLKSIRRGEENLQDIIEWAEKELLIIDDLFVNSDLPNEIDRELINNMLIKIRKECYKINSL